MESMRISGASWCSSTAELRNSAKSAPDAVKQTLLRSSEKALATVREVGPIQVYFVGITASDLLFVGAICEEFRRCKSSETIHGTAMPVILLVVNESQSGSVKQVLAVIEQRTGYTFKENNGSCAWVVEAMGDRNSRLYIVLGTSDRENFDEDDDEKYWTSVADARNRVAEMMLQCVDDAKQDRFVVYNTACPVLLSTMPELIYNRINAVVMVGSFQEDAITETFCMSNSLYPRAYSLQPLVTVAQNRFPVLFVDFSYSSSNRIRALHHLPGFIQAWPKLLHSRNYSKMLQIGLDYLYLNIMRFAGAARNRTGQDCADKAVELVENVDPERFWARESLDAEEYNATYCDLQKCVESGGNLTAAMDCPIDSYPNSLAALIPMATSHLNYMDIVAAQVVYKEEDSRSHGIDVALSETSPTYLLLNMGDSSKVDNAFFMIWKEFLSAVKARNTVPIVPKAMALSWKQFVIGTQPIIQWLVDDEKKRDDGKKDMEKLQKNAISGAFTEICKRSLGD